MAPRPAVQLNHPPMRPLVKLVPAQDLVMQATGMPAGVVRRLQVGRSARAEDNQVLRVDSRAEEAQCLLVDQ